MKTSKNSLQNSVRRFCASLITLLTLIVFSACSSQTQPAPEYKSPTSQRLAESTETPIPTLQPTEDSVIASPTPESAAAPTETPIPTPIPTLPKLDGTAFLFEEAKYIRDENCSRVFDYHKTSYGALTIGIADGLVESQDLQELAEIVIESYITLETNSPSPMRHPLTVIFVSNRDIGDCYSRDHLVFVEPDDLDSISFMAELLGAGTGISEYWVQVGLASLALGEQPDGKALKSWYQNTDDLDMAGLFYARFLEDWANEEEIDIAQMSAASLVQYALEMKELSPETLGEQVNNEVRTRWLEWLGVDRTVTYPYDGHFAGFLYSRSTICQLIIQADTMSFCLNKLPDQDSLDEIVEAEFFIDSVYSSRKILAEYLLSEAPSVNHLINPEGMSILQIPIGHTHTLQKSDVYHYALHEILHTFNWAFFQHPDTAAWLSEGFFSYLLKELPIYQQAEKSCVFDDLSGGVINAETSVTPGTTSCYFLDVEQFAATQAWYLAQGGQMESENSVDLRLYIDSVAFATMYQSAHGGTKGIPIGELYESLNSDLGLESQEGAELNITQAASFFAWLCDTYSIDRVLNVYINLAEDGQLDGKIYHELKTEWQAYLIAKGEGIEIPKGDLTP